MDKVARIFHSFAESDAADQQYYQSLSPEQRLEILLELISQGQDHESEQRLERVYRIVKLQES